MTFFCVFMQVYDVVDSFFFAFSVFFLFFSFPIRGGGFISDLSRDLNQDGFFCIEVVSFLFFVFFTFDFFCSCCFELG